MRAIAGASVASVDCADGVGEHILQERGSVSKSGCCG